MSIGHALLVSADPVAIRQFSSALQQLSISPDVCRQIPTAILRLNRRKFDAVIVDLQGDKEGLIVDEVRRSPSNRRAVTFAISMGVAVGGGAFRKKSDFVLERPFSTQSIRGMLKAAYGLILRERRRYFRCPVSMPVAIVRSGMPEVRCCSVNISEGGMAVSTFVPLPPGELVRVQFTLPDHEETFLADATICWWKTGHLGVRFTSLPQDLAIDLQEWLARKLEEMLPEFVAGQFKKTDSAIRQVSEVDDCCRR